MSLSSIFRETGPVALARTLTRYAGWACSRYLLRRKTMTARVHGLKMRLDLKHGGISRILAIWGVREADHTLLLREELQPGMTVLDIGANIGYYTLLSASLVGKQGKVIALEPDSRNIDVLRESISMNHLEKTVDVFNLAVSNRNGTCKFYRSTATNLNTFCDPASFSEDIDFEVADVVETPVVKLDDFLVENGYESIDFFRMDIEGYEVEALEGLYATLAAAKAGCKIIFEVHSYAYSEDHDIRPVLSELFSMGFVAKTVVSARRQIPQQFGDLGYTPDRRVRDGEYLRGLFSGISNVDLLDLIFQKPKRIRYVLLEKRPA